MSLFINPLAQAILITDISLGSFPKAGMIVTKGKSFISCQASSSGMPSKVMGWVSFVALMGSVVEKKVLSSAFEENLKSTTDKRRAETRIIFISV